MSIESDKQIKVLVVNIDSPSINQVNIGNTTNPADEPMNRADHTEPVDSDIYFQPYQKSILVGIPISTADNKGLSDHQSYIFCKFSWYQPITWPKRKNKTPMASFIIDL